MVAVEQLESEACKWYGIPRSGVTFYDLKVCRYGMVVHDILQCCPISRLLCGDRPFSRLLKSIGYGFANFTQGVARSIVRNGSVNAFGAYAVAKPCIGLVLGGRKAIDIGGQRADNLLRAVADDLKDNALSRLFNARFVAVATIFEL